MTKVTDCLLKIRFSTLVEVILFHKNRRIGKIILSLVFTANYKKWHVLILCRVLYKERRNKN